MRSKDLNRIISGQCREFQEISVDDVLSSSVDEKRFFEYAGSIRNIDTLHDGLRVSFHEPVPPSRVELDDGYRYEVVLKNTSSSGIRSKRRRGMPKDDLITLHQIAIVLWSIGTGNIYR